MKINYFVIAFILTFYLTACSQNTATNEHIAIYTPVEDSLFRISFEYPSQWTWKTRSLEDDNYERFEYRFSSNENKRLRGVISISCLEENSPELAQKHLDHDVEQALQAFNMIAVQTSLINKTISTAGGLNATYIEYEVLPRILPDGIGKEPESGFVIIVSFIVENQVYRIAINIGKSLYDSDFVEALDHLISSIKVIK